MAGEEGELLLQQLERDLGAWQTQTVNIGVAGQTKQGKSSLVNSIRGHPENDSGLQLARVGAIGATTRQARPFPHPRNEHEVL